MSGEAKTPAVEKKASELSLAELRILITGQTEFTFKVNDKVDITFKELTQSEMAEVDKAVAGKSISPMTSEYVQKLGLAKLAKALKGIKVNGQDYPAITDIAQIEELLNGLGESIVTGLILAYEGEIGNKFKQIEKKI